MNQTRQQSKLGQVGLMAPYLTLALLLVATFSPTGQRTEAPAGGASLGLASSAGLAGQAAQAAVRRCAAQASLTLAGSSRVLIALTGVEAPSGIVTAQYALAASCFTRARHPAAPSTHLNPWIARAIPARAP